MINPTILAVLSADEDRTSQANMFLGSEWKLRFESVVQEARTALRKARVCVVISDSHEAITLMESARRALRELQSSGYRNCYENQNRLISRRITDM